MGLLSNTVSLNQYRLAGKAPKPDLFSWAGERLANRGFRSIEETTEEISTGWVHLDDFRESSFSDPRSFRRGRYLAFTMRCDRRKVPAILLKAHLEQSVEEYLAANPGYHYIPKEKREDLRDAHRGRLLARTLPVPATYDVLWDVENGLVSFTSLGTAAVTLFEETFEETFEGLRLVPEYPLSRAERILHGPARKALSAADRAGTSAVLERIEKNRWLGWDFFSWLLYQTMNSPSEYSVTQPGPLQKGEKFTSFLDERVVLLHEEKANPQKVTVVGPQKKYGEVRAALISGKRISEGNIIFQKEEFRWGMTLRGERFYLSSFKAPPVTIERDDLTDESEEREAVFFERMLLLEQGIQLLHSIYGTFLEERLGPLWKKKTDKIEAWLSEV